MQKLNLQQFEEELGKNFWPVLRSAKKRVEVEDWGQVGEVLEMKTLRKKKFFKVCIFLIHFIKNETLWWQLF